MSRSVMRLVAIAFCAAAGFGVVWFLHFFFHALIPRDRSSNEGHLAEKVPLPHHVPAHAGGVAFRFAMVHDVVHERYPKHSPAYQRERERLARAKIAKLAPDVPDALVS